MKFISKRAGSHVYEIAGDRYEFAREPLVRDGGSGLWYVAFLDPHHGACLDGRVPEGQYRTLRDAKFALSRHLQHRGVNRLDLLESKRS